MAVCDYLLFRIKKELRVKTIQQSAYLLVKGIVKKRADDVLFDNLDVLFDIPKKEKAKQQTKEELVNDFENYIKGA